MIVERAIEPAETAGDIRVFDPMRICDGIEPSDDPILRFRPKVYDVSRAWPLVGLEAMPRVMPAFLSASGGTPNSRHAP